MAQESMYIGIDIGSATVKVVGVNAGGEMVGEAVYLSIAAHGNPVDALKAAFGRFLAGCGERKVAGIGTTGSGRELNRHIVGGDLSRTEIFAHAVGITHLLAQGMVAGPAGEPLRTVGTVVEIGGQDSKVILFDERGVPVDFNMNSICSAGTGEFLQQLADEAGIGVEEFGSLALQASHSPVIDSTCTVFSKRDFRHLTQKGVPLPDRLLGICRAMVANYRINVVGSIPLRAPVVFQGGVAANAGVRLCLGRALGTEVVVPAQHGVMGALGMAVIVRDHGLGLHTFATSFKEDFFQRSFESRVSYCHGCHNSCEVTQAVELAAEGEERLLDSLGGRCERSRNPKNVNFVPPALEKLEIRVGRAAAAERPAASLNVLCPPWRRRQDGEGLYFAGIDGGSRGTKYALGCSRGEGLEILTVGAVDTGGDAINAIRRALAKVAAAMPAGGVLGSVGTTGSAGELARDILADGDDGADYRSTEILAHYAWASHLFPGVRTVMDIGGNDSKIISVQGKSLDFRMNDKCAAGTGSFLEAVARRFEVNIEDYGRVALTSQNPARIAGRCAVFGESDIVHKARIGFPTSDLFLGLAYSICRMYLSDVAKGKAIAAPVVVQGGTFLNPAVREAFRRVLNLGEGEFLVAEDPRFVVGAGALGAALLARAKFEEGLPSRFKGFHTVLEREYTTRTVACREEGCHRSCVGLVALLEDGNPIAGYKSVDCPYGRFDGLITREEDRRNVARYLREAV